MFKDVFVWMASSAAIQLTHIVSSLIQKSRAQQFARHLSILFLNLRMASSKSKKPPTLRQRGPVAAEEEEQINGDPKSAVRTAVNRVHDQSLFTAFKKLKVDSEGNCVKRIEDQSHTHLKHKPDVHDASASAPCEPADSKDWSVSLEKFCFCEEGAMHKKGRSRLKHMCNFHRQRSLKHDGSGSKNASLVHAWRTLKPLLQESRFRQEDRPGKLLQAARFTLKPPYKKELGSSIKCVDKQTVTGAPSSDTKTLNIPGHATGDNPTGHFTGDNPSPHDTGSNPSPYTTEKSLSSPATEEKPSHQTMEKISLRYVKGDNPASGDSPHSDGGESPAQTPVTSSQRVFAAHASRHLLSFSSVQQKSSKAAATPSSPKQSSVPRFQGYRGMSHCHHRPPEGASVNQPLHFTPAAPRLEVNVERSCSQEARLDENEFSANELAAYLDNFLHLPKEMSSMAQMMYT